MAGPLRGERNACPNLKPPRPPNSWILFRRDQLRLLPQGRMTQADVSQHISKMWREAPEHVHAEYERRAEEEKAKHKRDYPNYRYCPMKKADKERMRQEKKKNKDLERQGKNSRRRTQTADVSSSSPAPAPQISTSLLDPPHLRYGPAGPTPPLSVASSPSDASLSPVPLSGTNFSTSTLNFTPVAPDLTSMSAPAAPLTQLPYPLVPDQSLAMPQWQSSQNVQVQANYDHWVNPAPTQPSDASDNILFDMPHTTLDYLQDWLQQTSDVQLSETLQAMLSSTGDPSVYQLHNFDSNTLTTDPNAELEISIGNIFQSQSCNSFLGAIMPDSAITQMAQAASNNYSFNLNDFNMDAFNVDDFLNYDSTPFLNTSVPETALTEVTIESAHETRPSGAPAAPTPYVPPAGAAFSSNRRVGASWKGSHHTMTSPIDHSPPRAIQVPAT